MNNIIKSACFLLVLFIISCSSGSFTDKRDNHTYRTIKIGSQIWMAENLAFKTDGCYSPNGDENNIKQYGLLYNWEAAQIACPAGWHLPSRKDFYTLLTTVGASENSLLGVYPKANDLLNKAHFDPLPAGRHTGNSNYPGFGKNIYFWTSTKCEHNFCRGPYYFFIDADFDGTGGIDDTCIDFGHSVRCLKD